MLFNKHFMVSESRRGVKLTTLTQSSTEVRNAWSYTSTPPYVFMTRCLVKHGRYRDNFTFTFTWLTVGETLGTWKTL